MDGGGDAPGDVVSGAPRVRVVLADDHGAVRAGLRMVLDAAPDIEVVGEAADGAAAVTNARALRPDVVLMDVRMPGIDGIEATRMVTGEGLAQVLVLTTFDLDDAVFGALRAGAAGFLLKSATPEELLTAVRRVAAGDGALAPEVVRRVLDAAVAGRAASAGRGEASDAVGRAVAELTEREREVLAALGRGLANAQIAEELVISEATAKTHVSRVLAKLGVASRVQAALIAQRLS
ncbi:response regulator [Pseudactinotalea suaedae]|uniref:response regulator n=1 Tax=Pseudactinotalea suaedae TaxID=1524924 RepID=UPI0012E1F6F4|nr:response regulator transcription factor [Pseudactinotalea suaedae]